MILIHAQDEELGTEVARFAGPACIMVTGWQEVPEHAARAHACILAFRSLAGIDLDRRLADLRRWSAHAPVTLVLPLTEENASALAGVVVERVVWAHHLDDPAEAARLLEPPRKTLQQRFADAIRAAERIPAESRKLAAELCEVEPPPASAAEAARRVGVSESTLRRRVPAVFGGVPGRSTEHLLEWLRLLRACDPLFASSKQRTTGTALHRHARTLQRTARRLTGERLSEPCKDPKALLHRALMMTRHDMPD